MLNYFDVASYYYKKNQFDKGQISKQEWSDYCMEMLNKLMELNKDVLDRLKNV